MIRPSRFSGLVRATAYARRYIWAYWLSGSILLLLASALLGQAVFSGCVAGLAWVLHTLTIAFVMPSAILLNLAVLRLFPSRTRRSESWRVWVGGILAAPAVWSPLYLRRSDWYRPPDQLVSWFGSDWATIAQGVGVLMLASSLALGFAWALPPWPRWRRRRTGPD